MAATPEQFDTFFREQLKFNEDIIKNVTSSRSRALLRSHDRILTTHCGSLPRPPQLSDLLLRQEAGEKIDEAQLCTANARVPSPPC